MSTNTNFMHATLFSAIVLTSSLVYVTSLNVNHQKPNNVQSYHHTGTITNNNNTKCTINHCSHFNNGDDVVFVQYNIIQDLRNGMLCRVSC